jgi:tetratricopeptide (TPR) repeat protein
MRMTMNFRNNFVRLASSLMLKGQKEKAIETLDKAEELMPDNVIPYNYFSLLMADLYQNLGQYDKAKNILVRLKERTQRDLDYYSQFKNPAPIADELKRAEIIVQQCDILLSKGNSGNLPVTGNPELQDTTELSSDSTK